MIGFIIFIFVCLFIIIPLYKSSRKVKAAREFNELMERLAKMYEYGMASYNFSLAQSSLEQAKEAVQAFTADIRLTSQELIQIVPSIRAFPNWQTWL